MAPFIPSARPPAIDDRVLATLTQIARDAQHGNCTSAEAEWLLTTAAPLLEELQRRRAFSLGQCIGENVIALTATR